MIIRFIMMVCLAAIMAGCSPSSESLIKDLYSDSAHTRRSAASKLMLRTRDQELTGKIVALLDDDDERVVFIATQILGSLSDSTAVEPLGRMVSNPNVNIRARACWSLGSIGHDSALPYVVECLSDEDGQVRYSAVVALGHLYYAPAIKHIYPMFRDPVDSVRVRAIQSLYQYRLVESADILASDFTPLLIDKSQRVRYVAVQALGGAWEDARGWVYKDSTMAGELLIGALKDENKYVRIESINSLKKIKYEKAVPVLKSMYELASVDEEVAISQAVEEITGEKYPSVTASEQ